MAEEEQNKNEEEVQEDSQIPLEDQAPGAAAGKRDWKRICLGLYMILIPFVIILLIIKSWPPVNVKPIISAEKILVSEAPPKEAAGTEKKTPPKEAEEENSTEADTDESSDDNASPKRNLLILVLLAGALGSYVHIATSFAYHTGLDDFDPTWYWWYLLRLPIGAGLALIFTILFRGGLLGLETTAQNSEPGEPIATIGLAALVGLFSPQALDKLGDIFDVIFTPKTREKAGKKKKKNDKGNETDSTPENEEMETGQQPK